MKSARTGIFCALDTQDLAKAEEAARLLSGVEIALKFGLEFFTAQGKAGIRRVRGAARKDAEFFLDLKFHDIPNTVAKALAAVLDVQPDFVTLHAAGGPDMMRAAVAARGEKTKLLAVTVLTSLSDQDLALMAQPPASEQVLRLARLARDCGMDGVVCSPHEIQMLRENMGQEFLLVTPGIRFDASAADDQKRVMTPRAAVKAGADWLVIGRPILQAADPALAARDIIAAL